MRDSREYFKDRLYLAFMYVLWSVGRCRHTSLGALTCRQPTQRQSQCFAFERGINPSLQPKRITTLLLMNLEMLFNPRSIERTRKKRSNFPYVYIAWGSWQTCQSELYYSKECASQDLNNYFYSFLFSLYPTPPVLLVTNPSCIA